MKTPEVAKVRESRAKRLSKTEHSRRYAATESFLRLIGTGRRHLTAGVNSFLVDQLFNSGEKRLARMLLLLANFGKESKPQRIIARISQETLAEMIGTTRSRVSFFMNKFRKLGLIAYNDDIEGGIEIHPSLLNVVLHEQPHIKS